MRDLYCSEGILLYCRADLDCQRFPMVGKQLHEKGFDNCRSAIDAAGSNFWNVWPVGPFNYLNPPFIGTRYWAIFFVRVRKTAARIAEQRPSENDAQGRDGEPI